jgi:pimeloyl-ACP methyl ester carboxylesterase
VATGSYTADPTGALAKADLIASSAWSLETVSPIVEGFFYRRPPEAEMESFRAIAIRASHKAAVEAARSNANSRTLERLGSIAVPTLIIQGRHDRARTPEHGAEMRDRIAGARLVKSSKMRVTRHSSSSQPHFTRSPFHFCWPEADG